MRLVRLGLLLVLVACAAGSVSADPVTYPPDPRIDISDPICTSCLGLTSLNFGWTSSAVGMGLFGFTNLTGINWVNLEVSTTIVPGFPFPQSYVCSSDVFANCSMSLNGNIITILFSGIVGSFSGITPNMNFFVDLTGDFGWNPNEQFTARANVPEPATITLIGTGIAAFLARRRFAR